MNLQEAVDGTDAYPILGLYLARARTGRQDAKKGFGAKGSRIEVSAVAFASCKIVS